MKRFLHTLLPLLLLSLAATAQRNPGTPAQNNSGPGNIRPTNTFGRMTYDRTNPKARDMEDMKKGQSQKVTANLNSERPGVKVDSVKLLPFRSMELDGLKYREFANLTGSDEKPVIVIFLHSDSGKGDDNVEQMRQQGVWAIKSYMAKNSVNGYLLVPQCPKNREWAGNIKSVAYVEKVMHLIEKYVGAHHADTSRIYMAGAASGGSGVWEMMSEYPGVVAAALIASGEPKTFVASDFISSHILVTAGGAEENRIERLDPLVKQMARYGCDVKLEILESGGLGASLVNTFSKNRIGWLFTKKVVSDGQSVWEKK